MTPSELIPGTLVQTKQTPPKQGQIKARCLISGDLSSRGLHAQVEFLEGSTAVVPHWQLARSKPPETSSGMVSAIDLLPPMASQPSVQPSSCRPLAASWKQDQKAGAIYIAQQTDGLFTVSVVNTQADGTGRQVSRVRDLDTEGLLLELARASHLSMRHATHLAEQFMLHHQS